MPATRAVHAAARRGSIAAALAVCLLVASAACGAGASGAPSDTSGAGPAEPGFPASVTGRFGTTTVPTRPARVVAMDWTDADFALSVGVVPVGIGKAATTPGGVQPWTADALRRPGGPDPVAPVWLDTGNGTPWERLAALRPDLILATKDHDLARDYPRLSQIAPVVGYMDGPNSDPWQQDFTNVATALGRSPQAGAVLSEVESRLDAAERDHPELAGKTFSYIVSPTPSGAYTVNSEQDVSAQVLGRLGLRLKPGLSALPSSGIPGRAQVSMENAGQLDADVVLAVGTPDALAEFARNPVLGQLPAVRRGAYLPLDFPAASALAFPSPLSLRWALDQVVPKLSAAVRTSGR